MTNKLKSLVFVNLDSPRKVGDELQELPLHVTITPPFFRVSPNQNSKLDNRLHAALSDVRTFQISSQEDAMFGLEEDMPVRKIGGSVLYLIHDIVLPIAMTYDRDINTTYAGDNYAPHVTYKGERNLKDNEKRTVKSLFLAQKTSSEPESDWRILQEYELKESSAEWR